MTKDEICFDSIYEANVIGYDKPQKIQVLSMLTRTATVQLIDNDDNGVVKMEDLLQARCISEAK